MLFILCKWFLSFVQIGLIYIFLIPNLLTVILLDMKCNIHIFYLSNKISVTKQCVLFIHVLHFVLNFIIHEHAIQYFKTLYSMCLSLVKLHCKYFEWVSDCCLTPNEQFFSNIMVRTSNLQWNDDTVCYALHVDAKLDFYSAIILIETAGRCVTTLCHIILFPGQPIFAFSP